MDTETTIEADLKISAHYGGVSPIGGGRMSFSPNHLSRISVENDNTFSHRILYADLVTDGVYKAFKMVWNADNTLSDHADVPLTNPAGEGILYSDGGRLIYIKSNVLTYIPNNSIRLPESISANGALLLDSAFEITNPPDGDPILTLRWATTAITAIGSGNFYCDLILAVS